MKPISKIVFKKKISSFFVTVTDNYAFKYFQYQRSYYDRKIDNNHMKRF